MLAVVAVLFLYVLCYVVKKIVELEKRIEVVSVGILAKIASCRYIHVAAIVLCNVTLVVVAIAVVHLMTIRVVHDKAEEGRAKYKYTIKGMFLEESNLKINTPALSGMSECEVSENEYDAEFQVRDWHTSTPHLYLRYFIHPQYLTLKWIVPICRLYLGVRIKKIEYSC